MLTDELINNAIDKVDLLLVIDNSLSMADKQRLLGVAVPDLVEGLIHPTCIGPEGEDLGRAETCPPGSAPEFTPVDDIHVGVITSSLGGYGAEVDCVDNGTLHADQRVDMAHMLGSLPRSAEVAPSAGNAGFLRWTENTDRQAFMTELTGLVTRAGERGCGWEAPLESWVRFLVDPLPYTEIVRRPCSATDAKNLCMGPKTRADGAMELDATILEQRRAFLRPDSLVAVIMLSDENDCSFRPSGQGWRLAQTTTADERHAPALRANAACSDPNSPCCDSCGRAPAEGCPATMNEKAKSLRWAAKRAATCPSTKATIPTWVAFRIRNDSESIFSTPSNVTRTPSPSGVSALSPTTWIPWQASAMAAS